MATRVDRPPLLLLVEDNRSLRETLALLLTNEGYRTVTAVDGQGGLDVARRERPDLIILDAYMPRLNGIGFCRTYRNGGGTAPIVLISAADEDLVAATVAACDVAAYIRKPFEIDQILDTVARVADGR